MTFSALQSAFLLRSQVVADICLDGTAQCNPPNRRSLKHRKNSCCDTAWGDVLLVMQDTPAGTVLTKNMLGYKTVPMTGLSGRVFHKEDLDTVLGRTLAFDLKRSNAILKTDLLPQQ